MTTKHDRLTEEEVSAYSARRPLLSILDECAEHFGTCRGDVRVLDWGCGRGTTVAKLLEMGFDACGVDVDPEPIQNGHPLFISRGLEPERRLIHIGSDCHTPFQDGFFHAIVSDQVLEHVRDIEALAADCSANSPWRYTACAHLSRDVAMD